MEDVPRTVKNSRRWLNLPTHGRFAKIVLWYRRHDRLALARWLDASGLRSDTA